MAFSSSSFTCSTAVPTLRSIREELMRGSTEWEVLTSSQMQQQLSAQLRAVEDDIVSIGSNDALLTSSILTGTAGGRSGHLSTSKRQLFNSVSGQQQQNAAAAAVGASLERLLTEAQHESISNSRIASGGVSKLGSPSTIATPVDFTYISCMRLSSPGTRSRAGEQTTAALLQQQQPQPPAALLPTRANSGQLSANRRHRHHQHRDAARKAAAMAVAASRNGGGYAVPANTSASMHPQLLRTNNDRKKYNFVRGLTLAQISRRSKSDPNLPDIINEMTNLHEDEDIDDDEEGGDDFAGIVDEDAAQMFAKFAAESYHRNPILSLTNNGEEEFSDQADWLWDWTAWRNHFEMSYALERIEEMEAESAKHRKRIYGVVVLSNIAAILLGFFIGRSVAKSYASSLLTSSPASGILRSLVL